MIFKCFSDFMDSTVLIYAQLTAPVFIFYWQYRRIEKRKSASSHNCFDLVTKSCPALLQPTDYKPSSLLCPWDFPGKNTEVGCHFLLQGIFPTQGSNPHLMHWQADSLPQSHIGSPPIIVSSPNVCMHYTLCSVISPLINCQTPF